jgi:hypothetical protein
MTDYSQATYNFIVGAVNYQGTPTGFYGGVMDEFRIYNAALTAADVTAIYGGY